MLYGQAVSREGHMIDPGADKGLLDKSGTWISFGGERMAQGRENARVFLKENTDIREKLENALRKKLEIPQPGNSGASSGANGHAAPAPAHGEKPPVKTATAAAGADASKARPAR